MTAVRTCGRIKERNKEAIVGEQTELGAYILALCNSQNLSLRAASMRAGLEEGTISKILQRDGQSIPMPETLGKIAAGLGGDFLHMMRLAGHLPPGGNSDNDPLSVELRAKLEQLILLIRRAAAQDPDRTEQLLHLLTAPVEIMLALQGIGEPVAEAERETEGDVVR